MFKEEKMIHTQQHLHEFEVKGNYYICKICNKQILKFQKNEDGKKVAIRSDGKKYTKKSNQNRYFMPDEWMVFEDNLKQRSKHSCKLLLYTGARWMEVAKAKTNDLIYNPKGRSRLVLRHTKTKAKKGEFKFNEGRPREVPLSKLAAGYLRKYIEKNKLTKEDTFKVLSKPALNIAMKKAARISKIKNPEDFSPHTLRKTLETWLMALGVKDMSLLAHFGHDIKTAASNYVSPDVFSWEDKKKMRQIIGDLYDERR